LGRHKEYKKKKTEEIREIEQNNQDVWQTDLQGKV
jgi:hypothetical protein